jgi:hypothetical protein
MFGDVRKTLLIRTERRRTVSFGSFNAAFSSNHTDDRSRQEEAAPDGTFRKEVVAMAKSAHRNTDDRVAVASDRAPGARIDAATDITEHDIARRAYDLYLTRGGEPGHDVDDWLQAERELRASSQASTV